MAPPLLRICASRWKAFSFVSSSDQPSAHLSSQPGVAAGSFNGLSASRKSAHEVRRFGGWVGPFDLGQWPLTWWFLTSPFLYMSTHQTSTTSYYSRKRHFLDDVLWAGLFSFSFFLKTVDLLGDANIMEEKKDASWPKLCFNENRPQLPCAALHVAVDPHQQPCEDNWEQIHAIN